MAEMPPAESESKYENRQDKNDDQAFIGGERKAGTDAGKDFFEVCHLN